MPPVLSGPSMRRSPCSAPTASITNLESIIKANDICNRYGIDTISTGAVAAFAMECYEKGIITKADADGLDLDWGNHRSLVALTEKIAAREGIGDILADGVRLAAARLGQGAAAFAMHVRGQEIPGHHPVASWHLTATYLTDATPARHTQGSESTTPKACCRSSTPALSAAGAAPIKLAAASSMP